MDEFGYDKSSDRKLVSVNPSFYRDVENYTITIDPYKAEMKLDWKPEVDFLRLCEIMTNSDLEKESKSIS